MSRQNKRYETEDGPIWASRSVAVVHMVVAVIGDFPYILVTQRADTMEDAPGKWCLPCGYLDWDETVQEASLREVMEETKLDLTKINEDDRMADNVLLGVDSNPNTARQNVTIRMFTALTVDELPEVFLTEETQAVMWASAPQIKELAEEFAFNHYQVIREMVRKGEELFE